MFARTGIGLVLLGTAAAFAFVVFATLVLMAFYSH